MARAQAAGLDLVEVAPDARPPVCRIMDYGKWKYSQSKKEQKSRSHRKETSLKEIRIKTPKIGGHDLQIKVGHAREFLQRGDRVQFTLRFRGRELAHIDEGEKVFQNIKETLSDISKVDQDWRREGRRITMTLAPGAAPRPKTVAPPRPAPAATAKPPDTAPKPAETVDVTPKPVEAADVTPQPAEAADIAPQPVEAVDAAPPPGPPAAQTPPPAPPAEPAPQGTGRA